MSKESRAREIYKFQERSDLGEPVGPVSDGFEDGRGGAEDA